MRGKVAKELRRTAQLMLVGSPESLVRSAYQEIKKLHRRGVSWLTLTRTTVITRVKQRESRKIGRRRFR